jgi:hypothetical protein
VSVASVEQKHARENLKIDKKLIFFITKKIQTEIGTLKILIYVTKTSMCASLRTYSRRQFFTAAGKTLLPKINCFDG